MGFEIVAREPFYTDKFGYDKTDTAAALDQLAKSRVRHTGHGREDQVRSYLYIANIVFRLHKKKILPQRQREYLRVSVVNSSARRRLQLDAGRSTAVNDCERAVMTLDAIGTRTLDLQQ